MGIAIHRELGPIYAAVLTRNGHSIAAGRDEYANPDEILIDGFYYKKADVIAFADALKEMCS